MNNSQSQNQVYPDHNQQNKLSDLPTGTVPLESVDKSTYEMQLSGIVFTGIFGAVSSLSVLNNFFILLSEDYFTQNLIEFSYWCLFAYFAVTAIFSREHLADDKPNVKKMWPILTAVFIKFFWAVEIGNLQYDLTKLLVLCGGHILVLIGFHYCYFAGKDSWVHGQTFKPWIKTDYESIGCQV